MCVRKCEPCDKVTSGERGLEAIQQRTGQADTKVLVIISEALPAKDHHMVMRDTSSGISKGSSTYPKSKYAGVFSISPPSAWGFQSTDSTPLTLS